MTEAKFVWFILGIAVGGFAMGIFMLYKAGRTAQREEAQQKVGKTGRTVKFGYNEWVVTPHGRVGTIGATEVDKKNRFICRVDYKGEQVSQQPVFNWFREDNLRSASPAEVRHGHALSWDAEHGYCDDINCMRTEPHVHR